MRIRSTRAAVGLGLLLVAAAALEFHAGPATGQARKEPVYVGVRVCAECHAGAETGHQYSVWRLSDHAKGYATLALPVSEEIARLSGITEPPQEARVCLGCHTTGADAEDWRKDETFLVEDGVQCETCHGPGSEYIDAEVMKNRELAMERGLVMPSRRSCMICHAPKGSHEALLEPSPWEYESALVSIAHAKPAEPVVGQAEAAANRAAAESEHAFAGVMACAACHAGPEMGFQFSKWRMGPHARAYASLATPEGYAMAKAAGINGSPQESPFCLDCHATGSRVAAGSLLPSFDPRDGVQCESCHGPGADYLPEAIMLDPVAARQAGLQEPSPEVCAECHEQAHGKPFDLETALAEIAHPKEPVLMGVSNEPEYKTPINLALTPDGSELWITCEASASTIVVDSRTRAKVAEIPVGGQPHDVAFSPDGRRAFITNRLDDSLSVVDVASREVVATIPVGDEPHGVLVDSFGRSVYVLNSGHGSISILDAETLAERKRLTASRVPWSLAESPDGRRIVVTNTLTRFVEPRTNLRSELTVIDAERGVVEDRPVAAGTNLLQGVDWHPSGDYAVFTLNRTKNLVPMTRLLQGWTITNGMGVLWRDGRVDQVLLDQPHLSFPDPADVVITPDGRYALVTSTGSDRLAVVDLEKLMAVLEAASPEERRKVLPNHLGKPVEFIAAFVPTGTSPRGVTVAPDGRTAYVAATLDDSVTVVDLEKLEAIDRIDLGGPEEISKTRWGEQLFHSADITFRRQFSCHSCHPDGHVDGITYDIEPDGIGVNPVDNRTLRGIFDTAPFKWSGLNPNLQRQCGPRLAVFFTRIDPFTPEELAALELYITTIPRPPNRYRALGAPLTDAQRHGKAIFERRFTNDGRPIPPDGQCVTCHPAPFYTDRQIHDVGTKGTLDKDGNMDTPHLNNIYDSAPYLHDGRAPSLEEIWTTFNPYDTHGVTNDLTKDELNHLIEYLKTL